MLTRKGGCVAWKRGKGRGSSGEGGPYYLLLRVVGADEVISAAAVYVIIICA